MSLPRSLWTAAGAAVAGALVLAIWFGQLWPARDWPLQPKAELIDKGRIVAQHFGLDIRGWKAYAVPSVANPLAFFVNSHSKEAESLRLSPLSLRVTYVSNQEQVAEVGFDSAGTLLYWRAPDGWRGGPKFASDAAASEDAFALFAQGGAAGYRSPIRTMGDELHEENYEWRLNPAPHSEFREWIKAETKNSVVEKVERHRYLSTLDDDAEVGDNRQYWNLFQGLFGLLVTVAAVAMAAIYLLWWARKLVSYNFPLRLAAVSVALALLKSFAGADWEKIRSVHLDSGAPVFHTLFFALACICIATVGRGISQHRRVKWFGMEQLLGLAPLAKRTGESIAAGFLFSPLLVSVPFLLAGTRVISNAWVLPCNAQLLYSRAPALDSLQVPDFLYLLLLIGFILPSFERLIGVRWLRWVLVVPLGALYFAEEARVISGPAAAPLLAGLATLALFWFAWNQFDLVAVLTMHACAGYLLATLMLAEKGHLAFGCVACLALTPAVAALLLRLGREVSAGDQRATNPALTGFRAEREKLKAEFSVARRAQQDMLPRSAPSVAGYTIAASCTPSLDVGGDLYDFWRLPDGRVGIGVADVSGKGVPAALYMTLTKGLLAAVMRTNCDLPKVLSEVNRHLHGVTRKKVFVTMVMGFLDIQQRKLQCARAGHNPAVWRQASHGQTTLVSPTGLGLGITSGKVFETQLKVAELDLSEGDAVVFYSDGITEAMNRQLEQFGEQRLMEAVERTDTMNATAARESILNDVREFLDGVHPQDDMTLVVIRVGAPA